jgi:hypothetical protein
VLLCSGQSGGVDFDIEFLRYQQAHSVASWNRDFPPFSPRYLWLDAIETSDLTTFDQQFKRWLTQTTALECKHLHTDLLISYKAGRNLWVSALRAGGGKPARQ